MDHTPPSGARRRFCLAALGSLAGLPSTSRAQTAPPPPAAITAETTAAAAPGRALTAFSAGQAGGALPPGWRPHILRRSLPRTSYELVEQDGRTVLHAVAEAANSGLCCDLDIDPHQLPLLSWSWRVDAVPLQATVADDDREDTAARVAVAFTGDESQFSLRDMLFHEQVALFTGQSLPFATLVYVWDGQAAPGTVLTYPRSSRIRYLVVQSGAQGAGQWQLHQRNLVEDFRRVFGEEPGRVSSVGVLCDSDDLGNRNEAWFGDFALRAPALA